MLLVLCSYSPARNRIEKKGKGREGERKEDFGKGRKLFYWCMCVCVYVYGSLLCRVVYYECSVL